MSSAAVTVLLRRYPKGEIAGMDYDLAFRFGFLATETGVDIPSYISKNWKKINCLSVDIYAHQECNIIDHANDDRRIIVVGDIYAAHGDRSVEELLSDLSSNGDLDALDRLGGRFALFLISAEGVKVFHDPFGSRTIYYAANREFCLASHAALCAEASGQFISEYSKKFIKSPEYGKRGTVYLPGDMTMYEAVRCLTPNCLYEKGRGAYRYWPRRNLSSTSLDQFMAICDEYFTQTAAFLKGKYNVLLGLTGGVDTRGVIAGLVAKGLNPRLVTWTGGRLPESEKPVVAEMVTHLGLPHVYMDPANKDWGTHAIEISKVIDRATGHCRGGSSLTVNMYDVAGPDTVFVRGYGGEIIRGFYNRHRMSAREGYKPVKSIDVVDEFTSIYKTRKVENPSSDFISITRSAMERFVSCAGYEGEMYGFDILDLFYWEQRMGVWGANMLNEMDPAVYSFVGLNSRILYESAFGLPAEYRLGTKLMLDITARYDPKFARIGVVS